jgi:hypothetical protein
MAKSDSFFIRASVDTNGTTYAQSEIDLGSFVNLGVKSSTILNVLNVSAGYFDQNLLTAPILHSADAKISFQLTTQTQSAIVLPTNKSVVSSGSLVVKTGVTPSQDYDVAPQMFTQGYLIGTDSMFLGIDGSTALDSGNVTVAIVMECQLTNATQANSVALALSQQ